MGIRQRPLEALEHAEAGLRLGDEAALLLNVFDHFWNRVGGGDDPFGEVALQHRQVVPMIARGEDAFARNSQMPRHLCHRAALGERRVRQPRVNVIAHKGQLRHAGEVLLDALLDGVRIGVVAGDEAERRPLIGVQMRLKIIVHPREEFRQAVRDGGEQLGLRGGALHVPFGERLEVVADALENLALDGDDEIRMHGQVGRGEAIAEVSQFATGVDEPCGAAGLECIEFILQGDGHARVGEVRMQRAVEIGGDKLERCGHCSLRAAVNRANNAVSKQMAGTLGDLQTQYDDAVLAYTMGDYVVAIAGFEAVLAAEPDHFEAQLSLGMAFYRQENYARAIAEGHKAEEINSAEQRVHTNLSLAYMKNGEKEKAEHHGLQAKIAGWKDNMDAPDAGDGAAAETDLKMAEEKPETIQLPTKFPDQPWKKKKD